MRAAILPTLAVSAGGRVVCRHDPRDAVRSRPKQLHRLDQTLVPPGGEQPSFDCAQATDSVGPAHLRRRRIGAARWRAWQPPSEQRKAQIAAPDQSKFVADQLAWIRDRNTDDADLVGNNRAPPSKNSLASKPCMASAIQERIAFLARTGVVVAPPAFPVASSPGPLIAPALAPNKEDARAAYARGDYATAMRLYRLFAEQGDANAQNIVGVMFHEGLGAPRDYAQSMNWYRKAAEQGLAVGQSNLGAMYYKGEFVTQNYPEAMSWLRKAADQGRANDQNIVGTMFENEHGVAPDYAQAANWYRKAADQGNDIAQHNLGVCLASRRPRRGAELFRSGRMVSQSGRPWIR